LAAGKIPVSSRLIDGEAIVCDDKGLAVFERRFAPPWTLKHSTTLASS
jgi:hypothetical protein